MHLSVGIYVESKYIQKDEAGRQEYRIMYLDILLTQFFSTALLQLLTIRIQTMAFGVLTKLHWSLAVWKVGCK